MVIQRTSVSTTALPVLVGQSVTLRGWNMFNASGAAAFVQLFDAASVADVTVGTTAPVASIGLSTLLTDTANGFQWEFRHGLVIAAATTATGNGAPSAALNVVLDLN